MIDDAGTVNAAEHGLIQLPLEIGHPAAQEMRLRSHMQACVIVGGLDPINVRDFYEDDLAGALDHQAVKLRRGYLAERDPFLGAAQRPLKSSVIERLQEVIESSRLEGFQGVLVESGHKNNGGRQILAQPFHHFKAVAFRHLHVKEEKVRLLSCESPPGPLNPSHIRPRFQFRDPAATAR